MKTEVRMSWYLSDAPFYTATVYDIGTFKFLRDAIDNKLKSDGYVRKSEVRRRRPSEGITSYYISYGRRGDV